MDLNRTVTDVETPAFRTRMRQSMHRIRYGTAWPEELIIVSSALAVGVGTGLVAIFFIWLLRKIGHFTLFIHGEIGLVLGTLLVMGFAGLIVGFIIEQWASEAKGSGIPEVMKAVAIRGGFIRRRVVLTKILASALTIGSGGSAGREGPIVLVGASLGSTLGQLLKFKDDRLITLVACGSAAGVAATFNAPIAGTIFAMEVILGDFTVRYFGAVVLSAVSASVVSRALIGDQPAFIVPSYPLIHLGEIPLYALLGLLAALIAIIFIEAMDEATKRFNAWNVRLPIRTSVGMLLTAMVGLLFPFLDIVDPSDANIMNILGSGVFAIGATISENMNVSIGLLAALLVAKMVATTFTLGSGNSGGVFAPSLFMGAALGGIVGRVAHSLWPAVAVNPGAYAIVGMAAVFAGAARAPITAILIIFEMSGDYKLILPLMLATVLATLVAELIHPRSIYTIRLRGVHLTRNRDVDVLQAVAVEEIMTTDVDVVAANMSLSELSDYFVETHHHGFPVLDETGALFGVVTIADLDRAVLTEMPRQTTAGEICTPLADLIVCTADESVGEALARMGTHGLGRLPVVDAQHPNRLLGLIKRANIIRAYSIALTRRAEIQHRAKRMRLRNIDGTEFIEITLDPKDRVVGKPLEQLAFNLPRECILVSIRRDGKVFIPHGDTVFQAGDRVTAFVESKDIGTIKQALGSPAKDDSQIERNVQPEKTIIEH